MEVYGKYVDAALSFSEDFQTHLGQKNLSNVGSLVSIYHQIYTSLTFGTAHMRDESRSLLGPQSAKRDDHKTCKKNQHTSSIGIPIEIGSWVQQWQDWVDAYPYQTSQGIQQRSDQVWFILSSCSNCVNKAPVSMPKSTLGMKSFVSLETIFQLFCTNAQTITTSRTLYQVSCKDISLVMYAVFDLTIQVLTCVWIVYAGNILRSKDKPATPNKWWQTYWLVRVWVQQSQGCHNLNNGICGHSGNCTPSVLFLTTYTAIGPTLIECPKHLEWKRWDLWLSRFCTHVIQSFWAWWGVDQSNHLALECVGTDSGRWLNYWLLLTVSFSGTRMALGPTVKDKPVGLQTQTTFWLW